MQPNGVVWKRDSQSPRQTAFTVIELLIVLFCMLVLGGLSLTALARSQTNSDHALCTDNLRRLMQAWQMYADDNSGRLVASTGTGSWVSGYLSYSAGTPDNTNTLYLTNASYAALAPYVKSASLFRCPADTVTLQFGGSPILRARSYSMNSYTGSNSAPWNAAYLVMTRLSELSQPDRIYVLLEEHPDSINDGMFICDPGTGGASATLLDFPAYYHFGGMNLGMSDGHVAYWKWADSRTMVPVRGMAISSAQTMPNNLDISRLAQSTAYLK